MIIQLILLFGCAAIRSASGCENVPDSCPKERIAFRLYTESIKNYDKLELNEDETENDVVSSITSANFKDDAPIKFILHGYTGSADNELMQELISEYLQSEKSVNVIMVNYQEVAKGGCYPTLFWNTSNLGKCGAKMILKIMQKRSNITLDKFHIIGFSIGAHIAAQISNQLGNMRLSRITGLDPAFLFFFPIIVRSESKLNKQHAEFVDIIHSNILFYGIPYSGGHYDFYANGGVKQPQCKGEKDEWRCYHKMAVKYFISTINNKTKLMARKIPCSVLRWLTGLCWKSSSIRKEVGEHATKPSAEEEGLYNFYT